jgi:hypothetical protein
MVILSLDMLKDYEPKYIVQLANNMFPKVAAMWLQYCVFFLNFGVFELIFKPDIKTATTLRRTTTSYHPKAKPQLQDVHMADEDRPPMDLPKDINVQFQVKDMLYPFLYIRHLMTGSNCEVTDYKLMRNNVGLLYRYYEIPTEPMEPKHIYFHKLGTPLVSDMYGILAKFDPQYVGPPEKLPGRYTTTHVTEETVQETVPSDPAYLMALTSEERTLREYDAHIPYGPGPQLKYKAVDTRNVLRGGKNAQYDMKEMYSEVVKRIAIESTNTKVVNKIIRKETTTINGKFIKDAFFSDEKIAYLEKTEKQLDSNINMFKRVFDYTSPVKKSMNKEKIVQKVTEMQNMYNILEHEVLEYPKRFRSLTDGKELVEYKGQMKKKYSVLEKVKIENEEKMVKLRELINHYNAANELLVHCDVPVYPFPTFETKEELLEILDRTSLAVKMASLMTGSPTVYRLLDQFKGTDVPTLFMLWKMEGKSKKWFGVWKRYAGAGFRAVHWRTLISIFADDAGTAPVKCNSHLHEKFTSIKSPNIKRDKRRVVLPYMDREEYDDYAFDEGKEKREIKRNQKIIVDKQLYDPNYMLKSRYDPVITERWSKKLKLHYALMLAIGDMQYDDVREGYAAEIVDFSVLKGAIEAAPVKPAGGKPAAELVKKELRINGRLLTGDSARKFWASEEGRAKRALWESKGWLGDW